jgi:hypothetical protein
VPIVTHCRYTIRTRQSITIDYSESGKGIFHWIGTNGNRSEWQNPSARGVKVGCSSLERGQPLDLIRKLDYSELWTKDVPSSWFSVDLGSRKCIPTHYTLIHGGSFEADILRNWYFQGSNDGENWTVLSRHHNDTSLHGKFATATFPVRGVLTPYRFYFFL